MTDAALAEFNRSSARYLASQKKQAPAETPDSLPAPTVLPSTILMVDGEAVQVIKDFQGDVLHPMNSFVWIPSLKAVVAGDIVFNGIHPWLADSTDQTRAAWLHSLEFLAALHPRTVVAGHKNKPDLPDSPESIEFMRRYLTDFSAAAKTAHNAGDLIDTMKKRYPGLGQEKFLGYAAKAALPTAPASK